MKASENLTTTKKSAKRGTHTKKEAHRNEILFSHFINYIMATSLSYSCEKKFFLTNSDKYLHVESDLAANSKKTIKASKAASVSEAWRLQVSINLSK